MNFCAKHGRYSWIFHLKNESNHWILTQNCWIFGQKYEVWNSASKKSFIIMIVNNAFPSLQTDRQINTVMHNNIQVPFFYYSKEKLIGSPTLLKWNVIYPQSTMYCIRPLDFEISHLCLDFFCNVSLTMTLQKSRTLIFGSALIVPSPGVFWHFPSFVYLLRSWYMTPGQGFLCYLALFAQTPSTKLSHPVMSYFTNLFF